MKHPCNLDNEKAAIKKGCGCIFYMILIGIIISIIFYMIETIAGGL